jgi:hypothetical protein
MSQVPGESFGAYALLYDPGGIDSSGHYDVADLAPVLSTTKAPTTKLAFGAQSHGLCTRCLRFVQRLTATDARLASRC